MELANRYLFYLFTYIALEIFSQGFLPLKPKIT